MISTFQALFVAILAVLPGSLYTFALVNNGYGWAWRKDDAANQLIRFLGVSAAFHALFAPATYIAYRKIVTDHDITSGHVSLWWWPVLLAYVAIPYGWGALTVRSRKWTQPTANWYWRWLVRLVSLFTGSSSPEPRAWDHVFSSASSGWIRLKLTNGDWKAGMWAQPSTASGYGEEQDLYLAEQVQLDDAGNFSVDEQAQPRLIGAGLLIRWSEVSFLEPIGWNTGAQRGNDEQTAV